MKFAQRHALNYAKWVFSKALNSKIYLHAN